MPPSTPARIAALRSTGLLDAPAEEAFDRVTRLATKIVRAPVALVSLVDQDRQFFMSQCGLAEPYASVRETPLRYSLCQHVVESGEPLIVADARQHPELRYNPAIPELGVVAYAGIPLSTSCGEVIGSFCTIDLGPRRWTDDEIEVLRELGVWIMREIELRHQLRERERVEEALRQLAFIVESSDDAIIGNTADGTVTSWNRAAERIFGYSREEIIGKPISLLAPPDRPLEIPGILERILRGERLEHFETVRIRKDGSPVPISLTISPIRNVEGQIVGTSAIARDIAEQAEARAALRESEERMRRILESAYDAFVVMDARGYVVDWNSQAERTFGWTREEAVGRPMADLVIPPGSREAHATGLEQLLATGEGSIVGKRVDVMAVHRDGRRFPVELSVTALRVGDSHLFASFLHDVTERKEAEAALRESEEKYRGIFENSKDGIFITNRDGVITDINRAVLDLTGYTREELLRMDLSETYADPTDGERFREEIERHGSVRDLAVRVRRKDGSIVEAIYSATVRTGADGKIIGYQGVAHDLTERRLAEEAVARSEAKSEMLSRTSHELRTPMNAILGFAQLLELEVETEENRESVQQILHAGKHLLSLIDEVLDIARAESGQMTLALEPVHVGEVADEALSLLRPLAGDKQIELPWGSLPSCDVRVLADRQRLKQVLLNLLSNAIKYNRVGGRVGVFCHEDEHERVRIEVRDSGPGILPETLPRLFAPFERAGAEQSQVEGPGLGLALSEALTHAMGGEIGVESTPGEGSTFWVELPKADPLATVDGALQSYSVAAASGPARLVLSV